MNAHSPVKVATRSELWHAAIPNLLLSEIHQFDLGKSKAGIAIKKLIPTFKPEGFRLDTDSTVIDKAIWTTPGTIFLSIPYVAEAGENRSFAESFPILVKFILKNGIPDIKDVQADLSSFEP